MKETNENDLKQETLNTVNAVKDNMKNINLKNEAELGKGYLKELVEKPISKIKQIANDTDNKHFKTALLAVVLWTLVLVIRSIVNNIDYFDYIEWLGLWDVTKTVLKSMITSILVPAVSVIVMSGVIYFLNSKKSKPLTTVLTTVITAKIPVILAKVIGLITLFSSSASKIVSPISGLLGVISTVLMFFGVKSLFEIEDDNNEAIKKFAIVEAIFYIAAFVISFLGISI